MEATTFIKKKIKAKKEEDEEAAEKGLADQDETPTEGEPISADD